MATYTTLSDARTAALANADYASSGSAAKARAFADAVRAILILLPSASSQQASSVTWSISDLREMLADAQNYAAQSASGSSVRVFGRMSY